MPVPLHEHSNCKLHPGKLPSTSRNVILFNILCKLSLHNISHNSKKPTDPDNEFLISMSLCNVGSWNRAWWYDSVALSAGPNVHIRRLQYQLDILIRVPSSHENIGNTDYNYLHFPCAQWFDSYVQHTTNHTLLGTQILVVSGRHISIFEKLVRATVSFISIEEQKR